MGLAAIRPLKHPWQFQWSLVRFQVAVGLAAIRPLKLVQGSVFNQPVDRCSGFGRYQAVETCFIRHIVRRRVRCSGFGRYQAVETPLRIISLTLLIVAVGLAAIRPLKQSRGVDIRPPVTVAVGLAAIRPLKPNLAIDASSIPLLLQWVWPLSGR